MDVHYFGNLHYDPFRKIKIKQQGLKIGGYKLLTEDAKGEHLRLHRNQVAPNEKFVLKIEDLEGFGLGAENQLSLLLTITISDQAGNELTSKELPFGAADWDTESNLSSLSIAPEMSIEAGQTYYWTAVIADKYSDHKLTIASEIEGVAENLAKGDGYENSISYSDTFFKIGENGLLIDEIFMRASDGSLNPAAIESTDFPIQLSIEKVEGIPPEVDFPDYSYRLLVLDLEGNELLSETEGGISKFNDKFSALAILYNDDLNLESQEDYLFCFALMDDNSPKQGAIIIRVKAA